VILSQTNVFSVTGKTRSVSSESCRRSDRLFHNGKRSITHTCAGSRNITHSNNDRIRQQPVVVMNWHSSIRYCGDKPFNAFVESSDMQPKSQKRVVCLWMQRQFCLQRDKKAWRTTHHPWVASAQSWPKHRRYRMTRWRPERRLECSDHNNQTILCQTQTTAENNWVEA